MKENLFSLAESYTITNAEERPLLQVHGRVISLSDRKHVTNVREQLGGSQMYMIMVAPSVDLSLIAAMAICLDKKRE
jgi:uncharacterized protein YxjI